MKSEFISNSIFRGNREKIIKNILHTVFYVYMKRFMYIMHKIHFLMLVVSQVGRYVCGPPEVDDHSWHLSPLCALHRRNKNIQNQNQLSSSFFYSSCCWSWFHALICSGDALAYYNIYKLLNELIFSYFLYHMTTFPTTTAIIYNEVDDDGMDGDVERI